MATDILPNRSEYCLVTVLVFSTQNYIHYNSLGLRVLFSLWNKRFILKMQIKVINLKLRLNILCSFCYCLFKLFERTYQTQININVNLDTDSRHNKISTATEFRIFSGEV